jgi:two-component system response regulator
MHVFACKVLDDDSESNALNLGPPMKRKEFADILLIEDSDADAELTLWALRKGNLHNRTTRVHDDVEALEFLLREGAFSEREKGSPKLILLDLHLPRESGIELLRTLKSNDSTKAIPVVILTLSAEERDLVDAYRLGVNSYLVKPVSSPACADMIAQAALYWVVMNQVPTVRLN